MIVHRPTYPATGRKVGIALDEQGVRLIEMGDVFAAVSGMRYTASMAVSPRRWINRREFVSIPGAVHWVGVHEDLGDKAQASALSTLLHWAISVPLGGEDDDAKTPEAA